MGSVELKRTIWLLCFALGLSPAASAAEANGIHIDTVVPGSGAARAGLAVGDVILAWEMEAPPPGETRAVSGQPRDVYDLAAVEGEEGARTALVLTLRRAGERLKLRMPQGTGWDLRGHPALGAAEEELFRRGFEARQAGRLPETEAALRELARVLTTSGRLRLAAWVHQELSRALVGKEPREGRRELEEALRLAEAGGEPLLSAQLREGLGVLCARQTDEAAARRYFEDAGEGYRRLGYPVIAAAVTLHLARVTLSAGDLAETERLARQAAGIIAREAPQSIALARALQLVATVLFDRGAHDEAEALCRESLELVEGIDPDSVVVGRLLNSLAGSRLRLGDFAAVEAYAGRAVEFLRRTAPGTLELASSLQSLGVALQARGRLVAAEELLLESQEIKLRIQPGSAFAAHGERSLASLALARGDLDAALGHAERALEIFRRLAPESLDEAIVLSLRGEILVRRGRVEPARADLERALDIRRQRVPGSMRVAESLRQVASLARLSGETTTALARYHEALGLQETVAPGSLEVAATLLALGEIETRAGDLAAGEGHLRRALALRRELAPGSSLVAEAAHALSVLAKARGHRDGARASLEEAIAALETQEREVGGLEAERYRFAARYAGIYRELVDLLAERGEGAAAFAVLEQSRARAFRALLAERHLSYGLVIPAELESARRKADQEYDQAFAALGRAAGESAEERTRLVAALDTARLGQREVKARIKLLAPRIAALESPEPLSLPGALAALEPGTLALSYSLGEAGSLVFALGPGPGEFEVMRLAATRDGLAGAVRRWQALVGERAEAETLAAASAHLTRDLLAPVGEKLRRAARVVIVADGALHYLPFAALPDPSSSRFLIAAKPVFKVASLTVLDDLSRRARKSSGSTLLAFGDPSLPPGAMLPAANQIALRSALTAGLALTPLPAARGEVEGLGRLFAGSSEIWVGDSATEEKVKQRAGKVPFLHFATHGFVDEHQPLDSGLVLAQTGLEAGAQNGLLQAWEILEQMELEAELVTLSACSTAVGEELEGEGILGLTRAFQHAGARSVLASLWQVADESTARLMQRFYGALRAGATKAEALREAQLELISGTAGETYRHPYFWAAFELLGEGR